MRKPMVAQITRPANTDAYAAGDVIGTATSHILTFSNPRDGKDLNRALIVGAELIDTASPATLPQLELWLFNVAPAAQADSAAFAVTDAEMLAGFVGIIPLATTYVGLASGNHVQKSGNVAIVFEVVGDSGGLYGVLVVRNIYTPISGEVFKVVLRLVD